jgi:hypothetical protein
MKEGGGGDHLSVGVTLPRSRGIRPVSRGRLYRRPPGKKLFMLVFSLLLEMFLNHPCSCGGCCHCCSFKIQNKNFDMKTS